MKIAATLIFSGSQWLWPSALFLAAGLGILFWSYRSARGLGATRWICLLLKTAALAALAFCLLEPFWAGQRAKPGSNLFLVVADNSQSMRIADLSGEPSRGERLRELLDPVRHDWPGILDAFFETRRFSFDWRLQPLKDAAGLDFDGQGSSMGAALRTVAERYKGRPVAGILLLTDGNATDLAESAAWQGLPPVYPVIMGRDASIPDISVEQASVTQTSFEDTPVTIQAGVRVNGFQGRKVTARLLDREGNKEAEQTLTAPASGDLLSFRFQPHPKSKGVVFYRVVAGLQDELETGTSSEAILANNQRVLAVDRNGNPRRILYVGGRPNWEFKFLNRAVAEEEQIQLTGLIRVAKREPKFEFRGRVGESGNPLFRGFADQSREETERYDQPVMARLNVRDEFELRAGFPQTPEELYPYQAVIVDDLEAEFFTADQARLLQKFVSERGGGFLMLGGAESFQQGGYRHTPIGDMLPVYLDRVDDPKASEHLKLNLTREGLLQPWVRLRELAGDEKARLEQMPAFQVINPVREVKPGASILAVAVNEAGKTFPALAVQQFGRGRTAALTLGDMWRWGLRDADSHRDLDKTWRQLLRWLVADVPERVEVQAVPIPDDPAQAVQLQVRVRDSKFQPMEEATVSLEIQPVMTGTNSAVSPVRITAEASPTEPGLFQATYVPRVAGGFLARASVTNAVGAELGRAETGWSADPAASEFRSLTPNRPLLDDIARKTGGEIVAASGLDAFARALPRRKAPVMEDWSTPFWHTPAMFALALGCLILEWGLRRWKGLP